MVIREGILIKNDLRSRKNPQIVLNDDDWHAILTLIQLDHFRQGESEAKKNSP